MVYRLQIACSLLALTQLAVGMRMRRLNSTRPPLDLRSFQKHHSQDGQLRGYENASSTSFLETQAFPSCGTPWCDAMKYDRDMGFGPFCNNPLGCKVRTLIYDNMNILKYPTHSENKGGGTNWQHMLLIRNGLCPRAANRTQCFVNPGSSGSNSRAKRCGACKMVQDRDIYLRSLKNAKWSVDTIKSQLNGQRASIKVFGLSSIVNGYTSGGGTRRKFQDKKGMWLTFKAKCGFRCLSDAGLEFLPKTFDLRSSSVRSDFARYFSSSKTYIAKNEKDAKQGLKMFKASSSSSLLDKIKSDERRNNVRYNIVQEFMANPALAKYPYTSTKGFKVNMRVYLLVTCSKEKREWAMLRAGSELHYALNPYPDNLDANDRKAFLSAVDTSYWLDELVQKRHITRKGAAKWPTSAIAYLENLKQQGWTTSVEAEWKKIEGIFSKAASVYEGIVCSPTDKNILSGGVDRMFQLMGADILLAGNVRSGQKSLQPYLLEWNSGPAFLDWGQSKNKENLQIAQMVALYKGGVVKKPWWLPLFTQKEYQDISQDTLYKAYVNVWKKTTAW